MYRYTLLIVESPTIASVIDRYHLPYLEVIPTNGYCWKPVFDASAGRMSMKVDPDRLNVRKLLREKIPWADKVVIATDSDSSGEFIAWSLWKHFRSKNKLCRNYLKALSPAGIEELIASARPMEPVDIAPNEGQYQMFRIIQREMEPYLGSYAWIKFRLIYQFSKGIRTARFHSVNNGEKDIFFSNDPVMVCPDETFAVGFQGTVSRYDTALPWNTGDVLSEAGSLYSSYAEAQEALNMLFTSIPEIFEGGLISYPRTDSCGFYKGTMESLLAQWLMHRPVEDFLPEPAWPLVAVDSPHEAIHPMSIDLKPSDVRPYLRKRLYELYTLIYKHTQKVIRAPEKTESPVYESYNGSDTVSLRCYVAGSFPFKKEFTLQPFIGLNDLLSQLSEYGVLKPSSFGTVTDHLIANGWLKVMTKDAEVKPGSKPERWIGDRKASMAVDDCMACIDKQRIEEKIDKAQLLVHLHRIISISSNHGLSGNE